MPKSRTSKRRSTTKLQHHLKRWLVPHKHNDHRPHLIRVHGLAIVVMLILGLQATALALHAAPNPPVAGQVLAYATDINPVDLLAQTNQQRAAAGLPALRLSAQLNQSAALKSGNMFAENYWAHVSPSGIQPWYWFDQAGYHYQYAGENLAKDFDTTSGVMQGWMNSPGHRANVLNANYTEVGFAVQNGTLVGGQTTLVVAHYGQPAGVSVAANVPARTPAPAAARAAPAPTPVPTAAVTPPPTPAPTATPVPSASPVAPSVRGTVTPGSSAPAPVSYSLFKPLSLVRTLTWPMLATIIVLLLLLACMYTPT